MTQTITIIDNETRPTISIGDVSLNEGNSGPTPFAFPVTVSGPSVQTITVNFATEDGTATAPGDYTATGGMVTFNPGVTAQNIVVQVTGDTASEPDETFFVNLSSPTNATISGGTGTGTILNDDAGPVDLAITKTAGGAFVANSPATYTITVTNGGPNSAANVVVTDVLPAGTTFVSATPSQGSCAGTTTVTCNLGTIASGGSATIALTITPVSSGPLSNTATASAAPQLDPNPANNSSTSTTTVQPAAAIPTLHPAMTALLAALLAGLAVAALKKRCTGDS